MTKFFVTDYPDEPEDNVMFVPQNSSIPEQKIEFEDDCNLSSEEKNGVNKQNNGSNMQNDEDAIQIIPNDQIVTTDANGHVVEFDAKTESKPPPYEVS